MATRDWSEQRAELLSYVDELRERARLQRERSDERLLSHGLDDRLGRHYRAQATRLGLAAALLLAAVHLVDDRLTEAPADLMAEPPAS